MSDQYDSGSEIGRTMWGTRFRGFDRENYRSVEILKIDGRYVGASNIRDIVARARRLDHDRIVRIHTVDWDKGWIISSSRETTLREKIDKAPISQNEARELLIRMLGLIKYFQTMSPEFVHGDICPENILFSSPDDAISDAKLLYSLGPTLNGMSLLTGRFKYYAPEMFNSEIGGITSRADVYSLGFVTLEALVGKDFDKSFVAYGANERTRWSQFHGASKDFLQNLDEYAPNLAPDLKNALDGMLVKSLRSRVYDPTETIAELKKGLATAKKSEAEPWDEEEEPEKIVVFGEGSGDDLDDGKKKAADLSAENVQNKLKTLAKRPYVVMPAISFLICAILGVVSNLDLLQSRSIPFVWGKTREGAWAPNPTDLDVAIYAVSQRKVKGGGLVEVKTPLARGERGWQAPNGVRRTYEFVGRRGSTRRLAQFDYDETTGEDSNFHSNATLKIRIFDDEKDVEGRIVSNYSDLFSGEETAPPQATGFRLIIDEGESNDKATFYVDGVKYVRFLDGRGQIGSSIDLPPGTYELAVRLSRNAAGSGQIGKERFYAGSKVTFSSANAEFRVNLNPSKIDPDHEETTRRDDLLELVMGCEVPGFVDLWRQYDPEGRELVLKNIDASYNARLKDVRLELIDVAEARALESLDKVVRRLFDKERLTLEKGNDDANPERILNPWDRFDAFLQKAFEQGAPQNDPRPTLWRAVVDAQRTTRDFLLKTPRLPADVDFFRPKGYDFSKRGDVKKSLGQVADEYVDALTKDDENRSQIPRVKGFFKAEQILDDLKENSVWGAETNRQAFLNERRYFEGTLALGAAYLVEAVKYQTTFIECDADERSMKIQNDEKEYGLSAYVEHRKKLVEIAWSALRDFAPNNADESFVKLAADLRNATAHASKPTTPLLEDVEAVKLNYGDSNINRYVVAIAEYFVAQKDFENAKKQLDKTNSDLNSDRNLMRRKLRAQLRVLADKSNQGRDFSEVKKEFESVFIASLNERFANCLATDQEYVGKNVGDLYALPWTVVAERFGYFEDNLTTFPREMIATGFECVLNDPNEVDKLKDALSAPKLSSEETGNDKIFFNSPTCPIQCLLFCNPNVKRQ